MDTLGRRSLDFFMRRGISDRHVRSRTLTFYVDTTGFREPLGIPDEEHTAAAERSLRAAIREATSRPIN
jgi:hypothetical protein